MNFNEWFLSLPEGRQAALRDDKWILAEAAYNAAHDEIEKLKAEVNHWKANHDNQVAKARLLTDRPDLPVERVDAYKLVESLQDELANTHRAFEAYRDETERKYGCYKPSCFAHDGCTCASGHMQKEQCPYFIIGQIKAENEQLKAAQEWHPLANTQKYKPTVYLGSTNEYDSIEDAKHAQLKQYISLGYVVHVDPVTTRLEIQERRTLAFDVTVSKELIQQIKDEIATERANQIKWLKEHGA